MSALGAMLPPGLPPLPPPAAAFWALAPGPSGLDSQFVTMLRAATFLAGIWLFGRIMAGDHRGSEGALPKNQPNPN